jgi:hypothetical protein
VFDQQYRSSNTEGLLTAVNQFYAKTGQLINIDSIDQRKINDIENGGYYTKVSYTEPVIKNLSWSLLMAEELATASRKGFRTTRIQMGNMKRSIMILVITTTLTYLLIVVV